MDKGQGNVRVVCRVRPLNASELARENATCLKYPDPQSITVSNPGKENQNFTLDRIFSTDCTQQDIFNYAAKPVINSVLEGFNGTVFAYGQTSSGKTHTMQGPNILDKEHKGIIPRMVDDVFDHICQSPEHIEFRLRISIVEIYMEKIRDLLDVSKFDLKIREKKEKGIYIDDVTEKFVSSEQEVYNLMTMGNSHRSVSATNMNQGSSRSHLVFILTINMTNMDDYSSKTGKLSLIDLAGSEKLAKTGATGQTMEEGKKINLSLTTLGNVINALTDGKSAFIPYRNSKLTRVLQESLGGNSKTTLIVTASPSPFNCEETIGTLRFGSRAKAVQNKAKVNRELTVGQMQVMLTKADLTIEAQKRRIMQLEVHIRNNTVGGQVPDDISATQVDLEEEQQIERQVEQDQISGIKLQQLEEDLERERESVKMQSEKLNNVKYEFDMMNARLMQMQNDNQELNEKVAELETKQMTMEQDQQEQEDQHLEELEKLLKKTREELVQVKEEQKQLVKKEVGDTVWTQTANPLLLGQKFLEELDIFTIQDPALTLMEKQVLETEVKKEFEDSYIDQHIFENIFSIVKGFKLNVFVIMDEDNEKDAQEVKIQQKLAQVELKRKDEKIKSCENEIRKLRENNQHLNQTMSNGDKNLNQKMKNLEINVEKLTVMYNQLMKNRSELKAHALAQQKKLKMKEDQIKNFKTALLKEKNISYEFRCKYETLKIMVIQGKFGNAQNLQNFTTEGDNNHTVKNNNSIMDPTQELDTSQIIKPDTSQIITPDQGDKKIIKHIRGGQNRSQNVNAQKRFFQAKLQNE